MTIEGSTLKISVKVFQGKNSINKPNQAQPRGAAYPPGRISIPHTDVWLTSSLSRSDPLGQYYNQRNRAGEL